METITYPKNVGYIWTKLFENFAFIFSLSKCLYLYYEILSLFPFGQCRVMGSPLIACGRHALAAALTPGDYWTRRGRREWRAARRPSAGSSCSAWLRNRCRSSHAWANVLKCAVAIESRQGREDMARHGIGLRMEDGGRAQDKVEARRLALELT